MANSLGLLSRAGRSEQGSLRRTVGGYISLTKPRIIELLLVTTIPVMFLAQRGVPPVGLMAATLVGGGAAAGAANAMNCCLDRDIDRVMDRTRRRPLATGQISLRGGWVFAAALAAFSLGWLALLVNPLSALLAAAAMVLYVGLYTMVLKRRTAQNIVWGGVAGCVPVLIGWTAVTDALAWTPVVLFLVVFFWTPPHYWPLSMKFRQDYAAAGVPMLPVVASTVRVARQVVGYAVVMVATSLLLIPVGAMGPVYTAVASVAGAWFIAMTVRLLRQAKAGDRRLGAMKVFHGSITYLTVLFVAVGVDPFLF